MKVSVVIPTYNRPELLTGRAIPSVLAQTVEDWELLVVGDGTDAETCRLMAGLAAADRRIRFTNRLRQAYPDDAMAAWGLAGVEALNWGWDHAAGDWVAVLGDDDEYLPHAFATLLAEADRSGADVVYAMSEGWSEGGATGDTWGRFPPERGFITDGPNLRRRRLRHRYALDCWDRGMEADADLWVRMYADGVPFSFVPEVVHRYWRR